MTPALLVDLDDTLYDEHSYVESGFRHVASILASRYGTSSEAAVTFLQMRLRAVGRGHLFNDLLLANGLPASGDEVTELVEAYRAHRPTIRLGAAVRQTLVQLRQGYLIAIVTDGSGLMQRRKAEALGLVELVDTLVYCWEEQHPKPSPQGFQIAVERLGNPCVAAVVGDDVSRDLPAAVALAVPFIRVRRGRFAEQETPPVAIEVVEVSDFTGVPAALSRLGSVRTGVT